ncbi:hypothetical protein EVAR_5202_1 [Eumeta japonica]|uniref:Uncharacterized protein n=1 Tax=Eumeta variegata TaxID=151549 RepID=A0A4C1V3V8_EUMVA|nr:hypothetical protein EVAR_5202_1 [Eumeta japonica]
MVAFWKGQMEDLIDDGKGIWLIAGESHRDSRYVSACTRLAVYCVMYLIQYKTQGGEHLRQNSLETVRMGFRNVDDDSENTIQIRSAVPEIDIAVLTDGQTIKRIQGFPHMTQRFGKI